MAINEYYQRKLFERQKAMDEAQHSVDASEFETKPQEVYIADWGISETKVNKDPMISIQYRGAQDHNKEARATEFFVIFSQPEHNERFVRFMRNWGFDGKIELDKLGDILDGMKNKVMYCNVSKTSKNDREYINIYPKRPVNTKAPKEEGGLDTSEAPF